MHIPRIHLILFCLGLLVPPALFADSWVSPAPMAKASPDANRFIRVEPGTSLGDTVGFSGAEKGKFAQATYYARSVTQDSYVAYARSQLLNPISPVDMLLNNAGVLVTLDNWHNVGFGAVVVIYGPHGNAIKSYELEDLYPKEKIAAIPRSVSSRWWRCQTAEPWINDSTVWITDWFGGEFRFSLDDGSFLYEPTAGNCAGQGLDSNSASSSSLQNGPSN